MNYDTILEEFPQTSKYIKIEEGQSFIGVFSNFNAPETKNFNGRETVLIPAQFKGINEKGEPIDQQLSCGKTIIQAFKKANVQEGDKIKITRGSHTSTDESGNPIINADGSLLSFTNYTVEVLQEEKEVKNTSKLTPKDEEIDLKDIPF